jgi:hypothetical protein
MSWLQMTDWIFQVVLVFSPNHRMFLLVRHHYHHYHPGHYEYLSYKYYEKELWIEIEEIHRFDRMT